VEPFDTEIACGKRFGFGENWKRFLDLLNDARIGEAEASLAGMVGEQRLAGRTFLDIGSGSGLSSLAARRLGAKVTSFDYDPGSVWCTQQLRDRFFPGDENWRVERGSALDVDYIRRLGQFDVVYSWGVLHHTGSMHAALENAMLPVTRGGVLFIALYRKTWLCPFWKVEKLLYCASPAPLQSAIRRAYGGSIGLLRGLMGRGRRPGRGMDEERDIHDWLGGYPYESITPRSLKEFVLQRGFALEKQVIKAEGLHLVPGCDEYVFVREQQKSAPPNDPVLHPA
jgi:SAM-dependent methyltransferase